MRLENRTRITRRDAIRILGAGAAGLVAANPREVDAAVQSRTIVRTILEDIPPERLSGTTLIHEHLSMSRADRAPTFYDDVGLIADEVKACAQDGISCIVDTGNAGLGRKVDALRTIATRSGVHIVASGGLYRKTLSRRAQGITGRGHGASPDRAANHHALVGRLCAMCSRSSQHLGNGRRESSTSTFERFSPSSMRVSPTAFASHQILPM